MGFTVQYECELQGTYFLLIKFSANSKSGKDR